MKMKKFLLPDCKTSKSEHEVCVWVVGGKWCQCECHLKRLIDLGKDKNDKD